MCVCAQKPVQPRYVLVMTLSVSLFSRPHPSMCLFCLGLKWTPAHVEKSRPLKTDTCTRTHTHKHAQIRIYSVSLHNFKTLTRLLLYFHNIYESLSLYLSFYVNPTMVCHYLLILYVPSFLNKKINHIPQMLNNILHKCHTQSLRLLPLTFGYMRTRCLYADMSVPGRASGKQ